MTNCTKARRVFILGAGFSKPAGFPLATELTDELLKVYEETTGKADELLQFAAHVRQLHKWLRDRHGNVIPMLNIEEFYEYADIYAEQCRLEQHREVVGRGYGETSYALANGLETCLSYLDEDLLAVLLKHEKVADLTKIERFANALRPGDAVVTFNYDRLIERCLTRIGKPWSFGMKLNDEERDGTIPVIKMHGSLDWACFPRGHVGDDRREKLIFSKEDLNRKEKLKPSDPMVEHEYDFELFHILDEEPPKNPMASDILGRPNCRWGIAGLGPRKRPSLIPGLGVVWEHARQVLSLADTIVIVGFSFSPFDRLAQIEFARVMMGRDQKKASTPQVILIDPALRPVDTEVSPVGRQLAKRIEEVFGSVNCHGMLHEEFDWHSLD